MNRAHKQEESAPLHTVPLALRTKPAISRVATTFPVSATLSLSSRIADTGYAPCAASRPSRCTPPCPDPRLERMEGHQADRSFVVFVAGKRYREPDRDSL